MQHFFVIFVVIVAKH